MDIKLSRIWLLVKERCLGPTNEVFDECGIYVKCIYRPEAT